MHILLKFPYPAPGIKKAHNILTYPLTFSLFSRSFSRHKIRNSTHHPRACALSPSCHSRNLLLTDTTRSAGPAADSHTQRVLTEKQGKNLLKQYKTGQKLLIYMIISKKCKFYYFYTHFSSFSSFYALFQPFFITNLPIFWQHSPFSLFSSSPFTSQHLLHTLKLSAAAIIQLKDLREREREESGKELVVEKKW